MMFKTIIFSGFLFATVCATETGKPNIATLDLKPNFDMGLTYKDFRVHYSGVGDDLKSSPVSIKIYEKKENKLVHTFEVEQTKVQEPNAYYFGLNTVDSGDYEVEVCTDKTCSDKNPALTSIEADHQTNKITCVMGKDNDKGEWEKTKNLEFDIKAAEKWIEESEIKKVIENPLNEAAEKAATAAGAPAPPKYETEWTKKSVSSNPSYERGKKQLYVGVLFDIAEYRDLFMKKTALGREGVEYAPDFCKRKYILSYHVHIVKTKTREVVHRFKKALWLSQSGKVYFLYTNTKSKEERRRVHVEFTSIGDDLQLTSTEGYEAWVSFCATEKDVNDSTVCSEPLVKDLVIS